MSNYKQIIIVRKDLQMSHGKMAAQVAHASMEFMRHDFIKNAHLLYTLTDPKDFKCSHVTKGERTGALLAFDTELYTNWIAGSHTKIVLQASNKNKLLKVHDYAHELGLKVYEDYYPIYDNCCTELDPEEDDGTTLTCIGFRPMKSEIIDQISKRYHTYIVKGE